METRSLSTFSVWYRNKFTGASSAWRLYRDGLSKRSAASVAAWLRRKGWGDTEVRPS